ncbi:hypothetical protein [Microcystis aeruginosa]|uniref:hypothetical protein n=1 Tax=Microcystis aeruginosa TaxID=1126 RepID=UPI000933D706|nr:hypothetical protein [Microcystis aeruginosa]
MIRYQLSVISYQLSVTSYQLSVTSYQLSVISYQLSLIRCEFLVSPDEKIFTTRDERGFLPYTPHPTPSFKSGIRRKPEHLY